MICINCEVNKLSKEFPPIPITEECEHNPTWCLKCTVAYCEDKLECPVCKASFTEENSNIPWYNAVLDKEKVFLEFQTEFSPPAPDTEKNEKNVIKIVMLNGNCRQYEYNENQTILDLKKQLMEDWKIDIDKQKLIYKQNALKMYEDKNHVATTLKQLKVPKNATIHMQVLLHTISDDLKSLVFEMSWEFPPSFRRSFFSLINKYVTPTDKHRDYIDATCFMFVKQDCPETCRIDCKKKESPCGSVKHFDTKLDDKKLTGSQKIVVDLSKVGREFTHLFFTLSARKTTTISTFPQKHLKFYGEKDPGKPLGNTSYLDNSTSRAAIMCSLTRDVDGQWQIYDNGESSGGHIDDYGPLVKTIKRLIEKTA